MTAGGGQENHGDDVLHDQDADGDAAIQRVRFAPFLENLDHEYCAGERQREGEQGDRLHALPGQHCHSGHRSQPQGDASEDNADQHVHGCGQPHLAAQQDAGVELEADREK